MPEPKDDAVPTKHLLVAPFAQTPPLTKEQFEARIPRRSHDDDAGLDLVVNEYVRIDRHCRATIPHGIAIALPEGCFGLLVPRSSTLINKGLIMQVGTIDPGYRGQLCTVVYNPTGAVITLSEGDRVSQLILLPFKPFPVSAVAVKDLPKSERGTAGFGSTGGHTPGTR
jgi:dUTP pyrophosphatase